MYWWYSLSSFVLSSFCPYSLFLHSPPPMYSGIPFIFFVLSSIPFCFTFLPFNPLCTGLYFLSSFVLSSILLSLSHSSCNPIAGIPFSSLSFHHSYSLSHSSCIPFHLLSFHQSSSFILFPPVHSLSSFVLSSILPILNPPPMYWWYSLSSFVLFINPPILFHFPC
ncbi:unnamed protein product [Acanthosepion pharaonis]|uniref:Uncharacterized protein n=1 Tax=Acanthosepion pharaonis TaxID=158019 RepID=A0A812E8P2_ACAPH|nr:unnamed protein product [Sepia pharaonis]